MFVVMGARQTSIKGRWSAYAVEKLLDMAGWGDRLRVVTGVLPEECLRIRLDWEAQNTRSK